MKINLRTDGAPAFPHQSNDGFVHEGMSLRDWFAGQAFTVTYKEFDAVLGDDRLELAAEAAYRSADAMLKARDA